MSQLQLTVNDLSYRPNALFFKGSLMSRTLGPLLNPASSEAMAITIGRNAFLREMLIAAVLPLSLPLVSLSGVYFYVHNSDVNLVAIVVSVITISALTSLPLIAYASLRVNAATLARERAYSTAQEQLIHKPLEGPLLLRRTPLAGTVKSRILSMFPGCIGFGLEFVVMSSFTGGSGFIVLHVPIGALLVIQAIIAANLLR